MEHPLKMYHVKKTFEMHQAWIHNCLCSTELTEFSYKSYRASAPETKNSYHAQGKSTAHSGSETRWWWPGQASWQQCPRLLGQVTKGTRAEFKVGSR